MISKSAKTKTSDSKTKPDSENDQVFAGGNPAFDERKPTDPGKISGTAHAGVNPDFDERQTKKAKPEAV